MRKNPVVFVTTLLGAIFAFIGVVFMIVGFIMKAEDARFKETALETTAVITDIEAYTRRDSEGKKRTDYDVYVEYTIQGQTIREKINSYSSSMYEGQTITVLYSPDNPFDVRVDAGFSAHIVFIAMGGFFALLGLLLVIIPRAVDSEKKKLMETGEQAEGVITDVVRNMSVRINGRHPFKAECRVTDPITGEVYLYSSKNVTYNIDHLIGRAVTVYYDPNNRKKYYVDLDSVEAEAYGGADMVHDFR